MNTLTLDPAANLVRYYNQQAADAHTQAVAAHLSGDLVQATRWARTADRLTGQAQAAHRLTRY